MSGHGLHAAFAIVLASVLLSTAASALTVVAEGPHLEAVTPIKVAPRLGVGPVRTAQTEPVGWLLAIAGFAVVGLFSRRRIIGTVAN